MTKFLKFKAAALIKGQKSLIKGFFFLNKD